MRDVRTRIPAFDEKIGEPDTEPWILELCPLPIRVHGGACTDSLFIVNRRPAAVIL
jgi:hypothetical protein